jgi:hypothetical protein
MEDFVANTSRGRVALLLVTCLVFVVMGAWLAGLLGTPPVSARSSPMKAMIGGWLSVIFFGLGTVRLAKIWWDNSEQLRIGLAGIRYSRWTDQMIPWTEINGVTEWHHRKQRSIILHLKQPSLFPAQGIFGFLGRSNRMLTGGDISISLGGTDRSFDDAMAAINHFRPDRERLPLNTQKRSRAR